MKADVKGARCNRKEILKCPHQMRTKPRHVLQHVQSMTLEIALSATVQAFRRQVDSTVNENEALEKAATGRPKQQPQPPPQPAVAVVLAVALRITKLQNDRITKVSNAQTFQPGPHCLMVGTSRCGHDNPGSNPGVDIFAETLFHR